MKLAEIFQVLIITGVMSLVANTVGTKNDLMQAIPVWVSSSPSLLSACGWAASFRETRRSLCGHLGFMDLSGLPRLRFYQCVR